LVNAVFIVFEIFIKVLRESQKGRKEILKKRQHSSSCCALPKERKKHQKTNHFNNRGKDEFVLLTKVK
jgi:hypothetical protein